MSKNNFVTVGTHPTTGLVITPGTKNPEWGAIRVDSVHKSMKGGILNVQKRSAFVRGKLEDLNSLGLNAGKVLPGVIFKKESFEPFYVAGENGATKTQEPKINPTNNEVVLTNGKPTYIEYEYDETGLANDVWVGETPEEMATKMREELASQGGN